MWAIGLLVMVSAANAQLKKGDLLVGGNIGLTLNIGESEGFSDETDVDVTFSLTPGVNYMLTDNWYIGGELGVSVGPGSTSTFTLGPSGGYYVPFNKTIGMMNTDKDFAFSFGYVPGLLISISDKMYLSTSVGSLGYNSGSKSFFINLLRGASLGFYYVF